MKLIPVNLSPFSRFIAQLLSFFAFLFVWVCLADANSYLPTGSIGRIGYGTIRQAAYSSNGKRLAVATTIGLRLIDTENNRQIGFYRQDGYINDLAFISNQLIALATDEGLKFVDLVDPRLIIETPALVQGKTVDSVTVSGDGNWLVVALTENRQDENLASSLVYIYSIEVRVQEAGNNLPTFSQAQVLSLEGSVKDLLFDPAPTGYDQMLAVATTRELHLWRKGVNESVFRGIQKGVYGRQTEIQKIAYNYDGKFLFVGTYNLSNNTSDIYIQEVKNPKPQFWQQLGAEKLYDLAFYMGNKNLIAYATDKTLRIWELYTSDATPKPPQILKRDFASTGISLAFHPYDTELIVGAENNPFGESLVHFEIGVVEVPARTVLPFNDFYSQVIDVSFPNQPNGRIVAAYQSQEIIIWNQKDLLPVVTLTSPSPIVSLDYAPSGLDLAVATKTNQVEVTDLSTDPPKNINGQFGNSHPPLSILNSVRFSAQRDWVASVATDGSLRVRRKGGSPFGNDDMFVNVSAQDVDFNYDGTLMIVVTSNGQIALFSLSDKDGLQEIVTVPAGGSLTAVSFSRVKGDNRFVVGLENGSVQTWEVLAGGKVGRNGQFNVDRNISSGKVRAVCLSKDGRFFAAGIGDAVWVWNYSSLQKGPKLFRGHTDKVTGLTFTERNDGTNILASSSLDGTILFWNIQQEVASVQQQGEIWRLVEPNRLDNVEVTTKIRIRMPTFAQLREETITPFSIQVRGKLADESSKTYSSQQTQFKIEGSNLILFDPQSIFRSEEEITISVSSVIEDMSGKYVEASDIVFRTGLIVWPGDTNRDGQVDVFDVLPLGQFWGSIGPVRDKGDNSWKLQPAVAWKDKVATYADANGDGIINQDDIVPISQNWRNTRIRKAPTESESIDKLGPMTNENDRLIYNEIYQKLREIDGNLELLFALEQMVSRSENSLIPSVSKLLPNYPNPFNPETWIPYQLSQAATVKIEIYNQKGETIRIFNLGYKKAGYYTDQSRSLKWDGTNDTGELVSSGVYFYHFFAETNSQDAQSDVFSSQRRFVILK